MTIDSLFNSESYLDEARALSHKGDNSGAESSFKRALETRKEAVGADDPSVAQYLYEYGVCLQSQKKLKEAEDQYKAAIAILEKAYYAGHGKLGPILEKLSDIYVEQKKWTEAEETLKRTVDVYDKSLSGDHKLVFESLYKLALVYRQGGKVTEAETTLNKALKTLDTPLGPTEEFRFELASLYDEQGKTAEAESNYKQAIFAFEQRKSYARLADCLEKYSAFLSKANKTQEAEKTAALAKSLRKIAPELQPSTDIFPATLLRA